MNKIKAVVFDFDGMTFLTHERFSHRLYHDFHIPKEKILDFFKKEFEDCKRGKKDLKKVLEPYLKEWRYKNSVDELLGYWFKDGELNFKILPLLHQLKQRNILRVLCTNNEKHRIDYLKKYFQLDTLFDKIITSYETGVLKPEKEILKNVLDSTHLQAQEILFCDDKEEHISPLKQFGFLTLHFTTLELFEKELHNLNLL